MRRVTACLLLAAASGAAAQAPMPGARVYGAPADEALAALLVRAERALEAGDAPAALAAYEQATLRRHTADIEIGWLHAQMQAGEYRRALAFAAHVAGAHRDAAAGAALYAWLLHLGAQDAAARAQIASASQRWPGHAALEWARERIEAGGLDAGAAPFRIGPQPTGAEVPAAVVPAGGGMLVAAQRALAPLAQVQGARALWLRDGLGRTRRADIESEVPELGLAVLRLDAAIDIALPARTSSAFPGSPAFAVGFGPATPAWPRMNLGFLGAVTDGARPRQLGFRSASGGPVFDHHARLVGLSLPGADAEASFVSLAQLARWIEPGPAAPAAPRTTPDAIYEAALPISVQVLAER
jgi:hypothetical protein